MHEKKNTKGRAAAALTLCFCVMALTSLFAVKAGIDKIESVNEPAKTTAENSSNQEASAKTPVVDSKGNDSPQAHEERAAYIPPADGKLLLRYSMDSLVYSKTLDQYMTHPGIDIAVPLSTEICAVAAGTVTKVHNDDRYGMTVEITHGNGVISTYSNLAKQGLAETGDTVKQGQTIGCAGNTALFESAEEAHIHFEMKKDNSLVDPCKYISGLK